MIRIFSCLSVSLIVAAISGWGMTPSQRVTEVRASGVCSPIASLSSDIPANGGGLDTGANVIATFGKARQAEGCSVPLSIDAVAFDNATPQMKMFMLFNAERVDRGLGTLQLDQTLLSQIDVNHSREMAEYNFFGHPSPINHPGSQHVGDRLTTNLIIANAMQRWAENIAAGYTPAGAVYTYMYTDASDAWGHRHNILGYNGGTFGAYNWVGVGVYNGGSYGVYYSSDFLQGSYTPPSVPDVTAPGLNAPVITAGSPGGTVTVQASGVVDSGAAPGVAGVTGVVFSAGKPSQDSSGTANTVVGTQSSPGVWTASFYLSAGSTLHAVAVDGSGNYTDCGASSTSCGNPGPRSGGPYHALTPARILDTRVGSGQQGAGQTLQSGGTLSFQVTGQGGVPSSGVTAVVLNVTVTNPTASSYLTVYPAGATRPLASNLNYSAGQTIPNLVEVAVGPTGQVTLYNSAGTVDVIADVQGYVSSSSSGSSGLYTPLVPSRILDTRGGSGQPGAGQTLQPGGTLAFQVTGQGGVPASGVSAVVLNVTITNPTAASYLTVYPTGATRPLASNLNYSSGQTIPNRVIVPVGTNGQVSLYNFGGTVDVIVDVGGYYTDGSNASAVGSLFTGIAPSRICDTRAGSGQPCAGQTVGAGGTLAVQVAGVGGVPSMSASNAPKAVVLNVTVTNPSDASYLTVYPSGATRPLASDLNFSPGGTIPNLVVVKLGPDGKINLFNFAGSVDVIVDVAGWYS